ncbi:MAG: hypothetical protein ACQEQA_02240 [Bacillota bacterium]
MNKLLIGLGVGVLTLFMGVTLLNAHETFDTFTPMDNVEDEETYYHGRGGYGPGGCHGGFDDEDHFQHHDWMYGSMFDDSEIEQYNQLTPEERETYEVMYARRVNALDLDSLGDEALSDKLSEIRQDIFEELTSGDDVE